MRSVREVIVVEGRCDVNAVRQTVDATVISTDGFAIFRRKDRQAMLRSLAQRRGMIILTDPDGAGSMIRGFLSGIVDGNCVKNAYVPDVFGKEKRKSSPSREGKLGVEGMPREVILRALETAGATFEDTEAPRHGEPVTKADLYRWGLSGGDNSRNKRRVLQKMLDLPERMSAGQLLQVLNILSSKAELETMLTSSDPSGTQDRAAPEAVRLPEDPTDPQQDTAVDLS